MLPQSTERVVDVLGKPSNMYFMLIRQAAVLKIIKCISEEADSSRGMIMFDPVHSLTSIDSKTDNASKFSYESTLNRTSLYN